jgi:hypothetical protein
MAGQPGGGGGFGGGGGGPKGNDSDGDSGKGNALNEEVIWRARAVRAETQIEELQAKVDQISSELEQTRSAANQSDQKRALELELALADAQDIDTAVLVAQSVLAQMEEPDIKAAVAELRTSKPFLFRTSPAVSAMSGRVPSAGPGAVLGDLADEARESGDRALLLQYLRARRGN